MGFNRLCYGKRWCSLIIFDNQPYLKEWAGKILGFTPPEDSKCIGQQLEGELRAVVVFCGMAGKSCQIHIASSGSHWMTKDFLWVTFDYPFNKLGLKVILGTVAGSNEKALKLDRHLGFKEVAMIPDAHDEGDLVIFEMRPEFCKWLKLNASLKQLGA